MDAQTKFIVWDWNGTLLDDVRASHEGLNIILRHFKKPSVDIGAFREIFDMPIRNLYRNAGFSDAEIERDMLSMQHLFHDSYEPLAARADLRAGAKQVFMSAKAARIINIILSNHLIGSINNHLDRLGITTAFDFVLANEDRVTQMGNMTKGEKLHRLMNDKNLSPKNGIIIGDTPEETHIAHEFGLCSVTLTDGCVSETRLRTAGPDHLIHSLHELKPILQERGFVS